MIDMEQSARSEGYYQKPVDVFRYRVNLKNTGIKVIKAIVWDYQASDTDEFIDVTHRQFRCSAKIKPNENERLEGYSTLPPTHVIAASGKKNFSERAIINRIEYADGTSWQRAEWHQPDGKSNYGSKGDCQQF